MIAPNNIHPPKNWQDFEMLCLKLWGEIWNIPDEIEFNSDNAQGQHGVDIYGPVDGGLRYNGIQCKNKKLNLIDGSPNRITIADIDAEIKKAKDFKPALNKLVIATSLPKDQKIEEHIRLKSVENLEAGLFSIQICFWEFFERKLPEYQRIYDWYLKHENFLRISSANVVFSTDGSIEQVYHPKYQKTIDSYIVKVKEEKEELDMGLTHAMFGGNTDLARTIARMQKMNQLQPQISFPSNRSDWKQNFWFKLRIENTGQSVIEDFKLEIDFEGDFEKVGAESRSGIYAQHFTTDVHGYSNTKKSVYVKPVENTLVQGDSYTSDYIYLEPKMAVTSEVIVYWKILARDFIDEGKLTIHIEPMYHRVEKTHEVETKEEERSTTNISLIRRPGQLHMLDGGFSFSDNESDYTFTKD